MGNSSKIGIALGSGAARGLAHIGVLKALDENNINIDMISGSSAGALIGGLYAFGTTPDRIKNIANQIDNKLWVDLTVPKKGFIKGEKIEELVRLLTRSQNIEDLLIPLNIIATDLKSGSQFIFKKGPLYKAIRASISIPGVFEPVTMEEKVLVDGAVTNRVPVSILKEMGADILIGVDVGYSSNPVRLNHVFDIIFQSIDVMSEQLVEKNILHCDILIKPPLSHISPFKFNLVDECFDIGYNETLKFIDEIKRKISP